MTYKTYIKKDYKPRVRYVHSQAHRKGGRGRWFLAIALCIVTGVGLAHRAGKDPDVQIVQRDTIEEAVISPLPKEPEPDNGFVYQTVNYTETLQPVEHIILAPEPTELAIISPVSPTDKDAEVSILDSTVNEPASRLEHYKIKKGDSLSLIFDQLHLSPQELYKIMSIGKPVAILKRLMPGNELRIEHSDGEVISLEYDINLINTLKVSQAEDTYHAETLTAKLDTMVSVSSGIITDSLFMSAQRAGLSDNLTMQLVHLYGWDIDFVLDIREGDRFYVIYEEQFKDGVKVKEGPILAAEFVNRNNPYRAFRYTHADGHSDYYNEDGLSMRKAFLRTPVKFSRISSGFSLKRKHPVLNTIRSHKGVDYAAPTGTPIKATGDGSVTYAGYKGGYGRVVIIRHGSQYDTLYGHMSRIAKGIRPGIRVKQEQIIGYVGKTGLATGPHLHYEFRVNGVHRNPLTVKLPKAKSIPKNEMNDFKAATQSLYAELDVITGKLTEAASSSPFIALIEQSEDDKPPVD